jgi:putative transcriptional regulator
MKFTLQRDSRFPMLPWHVCPSERLEPERATSHAGRMKTQEDWDLGGKLLIAMPGMGDPRFESSVILICAHSPDGAMGLIVNKPTLDLSFAGLLEQLGIAHSPDAPPIRVHFGGPVERGRGFVLHSRDYTAEGATMDIAGSYGMTATQDVLTALGRGAGPRAALLALGYAGWGPGQLEQELARNDWLTGEASEELIFAPEDGGKWAAALRHSGIDPSALSGTGGRA